MKLMIEYSPLWGYLKIHWTEFHYGLTVALTRHGKINIITSQGPFQLNIQWLVSLEIVLIINKIPLWKSTQAHCAWHHSIF